jgi:hypothetical protein
MKLHKIAKFSPELARNIWLEISIQRLIFAPMFIAAMVIIIVQSGSVSPSLVPNGPEGLPHIGLAMLGLGIFGLITLLWGSTAISNSVSDEGKENTWDFQRISSITPLQMLIGKLFGSTIYLWYIGLIGIAIYIFVIFSVKAEDCVYQLSGANLRQCEALLGTPFTNLALLITFTLFFHGMMLLSSIRNKEKKRSRIGFLFISLFLSASIFPALMATYVSLKNITWYNTAFNGTDFILVTLQILTAWMLIACFRAFREEFQYKNYPWVWTSFIIFINIFFVGFTFKSSNSFIDQENQIFLALFITILLTYYSLFEEKKDFINYKKWCRDVRTKNFKHAWLNTPRWFISVAFCLISSIAILLVQDFEHGEMPKTLIALAAAILFIIRDVIIVHYCHANFESTHKNFIAILYLSILYVILPLLVSVFSSTNENLHFFFQMPGKIESSTPLISAAVQCALFGFLLYKRLKSNSSLFNK